MAEVEGEGAGGRLVLGGRVGFPGVELGKKPRVALGRGDEESAAADADDRDEGSASEGGALLDDEARRRRRPSAKTADEERRGGEDEDDGDELRHLLARVPAAPPRADR